MHMASCDHRSWEWFICVCVRNCQANTRLLYSKNSLGEQRTRDGEIYKSPKHETDGFSMTMEVCERLWSILSGWQWSEQEGSLKSNSQRMEKVS